MSTINWWAVLIAGISSFAIGGVWYSPALFGKAWLKDAHLTEEQIRQGNPGKIFGFAFIFSMLMAVNLGMFLADSPASCPADCAQRTNAAWGATAGFLAGIWTFSAIATICLFEQKSWRLIFIHGMYSVVTLTLMGLIIGAWR